MKSSIKSLFLALGICCVHVTVPSSLTIDPNWSREVLEEKLDYFNGILTALEGLKPEFIVNIEQWKRDVRLAEDAIRQLGRQLLKMRIAERGDAPASFTIDPNWSREVLEEKLDYFNGILKGLKDLELRSELGEDTNVNTERLKKDMRLAEDIIRQLGRRLLKVRIAERTK